MVVFTCNHCGESLQKPRVEKHYTIQCRRAKSLTCVDCFKDFKNEEYAVHTKCITEEERYSAKGSIPGGVVKKGDVKQESWTDMIKSIVQNEQDLKPSLKSLFETISTYTNVPRKKVKFINFLKSSSGGRVNFGDIEAAWDLIEKYKKEQKENSEVKENGTKHKLSEDTEAPVKKKKKSKGVKEEKSEELKDDEGPTEQNGKETEANDSESAPVKKKKKKSKDNDNSSENTAEPDKKKKKIEETEQAEAELELKVEQNGKNETEANDSENAPVKKKKKKSKDNDNSGENTAEPDKKIEEIKQVEAELEQLKVEQNGKNETETNDSENAPVKKKKKKSKDNDNSGENTAEPDKKKKKIEETKQVEDELEQSNKFNFKDAILSILNSNGSIPVKKLQKKVLAAYLKETGNAEYTEKTVKKYNKKLKKLSNVTIDDNVASLISNSEQ